MKNISIIGIPYDKKSSFLKGPALAPPLIRQCLYSDASNSYAENGMNIRSDRIKDLGDRMVDEYFDIQRIAEKELANGNRLFTIGGDHSITYPLLKAYKNYFPSFSVLHIDAHADLYEVFEGDKYSHACPFARIMEDRLTDRLVQLGIRTLNPHQREQAKKYAVEIIEMKDFEQRPLPVFKRPLYLSLDLDAIDPAFAPGVSHQEPGGFSGRAVIRIIQSLEVPVIGADLVEYNPLRDSKGITAALAAKLSKEILSIMLKSTNK